MPTDSIRILKSHALHKFLPDDITDDPKAKVIYVARNPKDAAVSFYHFCQYIIPMPDYASWDEFFEEFITDRSKDRNSCLFHEYTNRLGVGFMSAQIVADKLRGFSFLNLIPPSHLFRISKNQAEPAGMKNFQNSRHIREGISNPVTLEVEWAGMTAEWTLFI